MTPKHSIENISLDASKTEQGVSVADLAAKINSSAANQSVLHNHKHHKDFAATNDVLRIIKGNPTPQELAILTSIFTVLAARDKALRTTRDHWPSPHSDAAMRGPFGTFTQYRTNLRWW